MAGRANARDPLDEDPLDEDPHTQEPLDTEAALRALAHPGRRRALQLVSGAARSSGELAEACGWTRPATSQHLKVLRDAGLIEVRRDGQRRLYLARRERLAQLRAFLDDFWATRLGELGGHIEAGREERP